MKKDTKKFYRPAYHSTKTKQKKIFGRENNNKLCVTAMREKNMRPEYVCFMPKKKENLHNKTMQQNEEYKMIQEIMMMMMRTNNKS